MPRDGSLTPRDLVEKLDVLVVPCDKCGRSGRYRVLRLAEQIGWDGKLTYWLSNLTARLSAQAQAGLQRPVRRALPGLAEGALDFGHLLVAVVMAARAATKRIQSRCSSRTGARCW